MESGKEFELLSAFVDGALDPWRHVLVEHRVDNSRALRAEILRLKVLSALVRMHAVRHAAPSGLTANVRHRVQN